MKTLLASCCAILIFIAYFQYKKIERLDTALGDKEKELISWQKKANAAHVGQLALSIQAQACLDRETRRSAESGIWQEIIEQSQSRDMEDSEKKRVPDDQTRRKLLVDLDQPL